MERRNLRTEIRTDSPTKVFGYAAAFDSPTTIRDCTGRTFQETIVKGAFTRSLQEQPDVRLLRDHNPSLLFARTKAGTLRVGEDDYGLWFEADLPDTPEARSLVESVKRGDLDGCSFGFNVVKDAWTEGPHRRLEDVTLYEVSITAFPAYEQGTSVDLRSVQLTTKAPVKKMRARLRIREAEGR